MPKLLKIIIPILVVAAAVGVFAFLKATRPHRPVAAIEERVWRVEVEPARPARLAPQLVLYGRVENPDLLKVAASGPARVAEVAVRDGQRVAAGDLLIQLDDRDFLPALRQAEALVAELEAQVQSEMLRHDHDQRALEQERKLLDLARNGVARAERLKTQRAGSDADLDAAEQAVAQQTLAVTQRERDIADHPARRAALAARLASARAKVEETALGLARSRVLAPFEGLVAGVEASVGDQVKEDALLLRLYAVADLEVRARIPAPYQAEIAAALAAGATLEATAVGGLPRLRLERLAGEAQPSGAAGLFRVLAGGEALRLGQMLELRLSRPPRDDLVALPFAAVQGGDRIYRLVDGRLRGLEVEVLGPWSDGGEERLLIHSPALAAGDRVLVTHLPNALDGLKVEALP